MGFQDVPSGWQTKAAQEIHATFAVGELLRVRGTGQRWEGREWGRRNGMQSGSALINLFGKLNL